MKKITGRDEKIPLYVTIETEISLEKLCSGLRN